MDVCCGVVCKLQFGKCILVGWAVAQRSSDVCQGNSSSSFLRNGLFPPSTDKAFKLDNVPWELQPDIDFLWVCFQLSTAWSLIVLSSVFHEAWSLHNLLVMEGLGVLIWEDSYKTALSVALFLALFKISCSHDSGTSKDEHSSLQHAVWFLIYLIRWGSC